MVFKGQASGYVCSRRMDRYDSRFDPGDSKSLPIGIFDSGVGGLTVLRQLRRQLPHESFLYFGDTVNVPYGGRSPEELLGFTRNILNWMMRQPVKMAIMACNTSSAWTLEKVRHDYPFPILGIILPGAQAAAKCGQRVGVIATQATVDSNCYANAIREVDPTISVFQMACPEFVPLVEQGKLDDGETHCVIEKRLTPLIEARIQALVYGCTHYPHLSRALKQHLPSSIKLIDPAVYMAKAAAQELRLLRVEAHSTTNCSAFFVSGCSAQFMAQTYQLMGERPQVQSIDISAHESTSLLAEL